MHRVVVDLSRQSEPIFEPLIEEAIVVGLSENCKSISNAIGINALM
jgi:hypothetical protein